MSTRVVTTPTRQREDGDFVATLPRKPLDNPPRPKRTYASDEECSALLGQVLSQVPSSLRPSTGSRFPLLDGLITLDALSGSDRAREIIYIAAVNHRTADERRTAEYLLRNRHDVAAGRRTSTSLLFAARYAAEMDVRRAQHRESPLPRVVLSPMPEEFTPEKECDSAGALVIETLQSVFPQYVISPQTEALIHIGVVIALEVAQRHTYSGGRLSAVLAMRSDARACSRLVTHIRQEIQGIHESAYLARLLVGPDGSSVDTALLRWSVKRDISPADVPKAIRERWLRCLRGLELPPACRRFPQVRVAPLDDHYANNYKSGITDDRSDPHSIPDGPSVEMRGRTGVK